MSRTDITKTTDETHETVVVRNADGKVTLIFNQTKTCNLDGPWLYFTDTGEVWENSTYKDGRTTGLSTIYKPNGTLLQQNIYEDGKYHGEFRRHDGKSVEVKFFDMRVDVTEKVLPLVQDINDISAEEAEVIKEQLGLPCIEQRIPDVLAVNDPMRGVHEVANRRLEEMNNAK